MNKREAFGRLYPPLVKVRHAPPVRIVAALPIVPSQVLRARRNAPVFAVDIEGVMGMGAVLSHGLRLCRYAESHGLVPRITSTNPLYSAGPGQDCLGPYLGSAEQAAVQVLPLRYRHSESLFHLRIPRRLRLDHANRLLAAWFRPREAITAAVDSVLAEAGRSSFDLTIHVRGTDKILEAEAVSFTTVEAAVARHVSAGGALDHVFLATDDAAFEAFARARWPGTAFTTYNLGGPPSPSGWPRHFSGMPPEQKALEALVNMVLLSKAPRCIRTSSYMSAISKILNPVLITETLNRMRAGSRLFPEHEIHAEELGRAGDGQG